MNDIETLQIHITKIHIERLHNPDRPELTGYRLQQMEKLCELQDDFDRCSSEAVTSKNC